MNTLIESIRELVGSNGILTGEDVTSRSDSWPPMGGCQALAIVRPSDTEQVSEVLKLCQRHNQAVVTHGGKTGLVGGAKAGPGEIALSLERMTRMEAVDGQNRTITVDAGVPLQKVQEAAHDAGLLFPLIHDRLKGFVLFRINSFRPPDNQVRRLDCWRMRQRQNQS